MRMERPPSRLHRGHNYMKRSLYMLVYAALFLSFPSSVFAVACTGIPAIGNIAMSNCTLTVASTTGADAAHNIESAITNDAITTLNAGAAVTINSGGVLATGSIILNGGTIAIATGGSIKSNTPIYASDGDADGWTASLGTLYTATASGRRRFSLMRSATATDCADSSYNMTNQCCVANGAACASNGTCCSSICGTNADGDSYFSAAAGTTGICQAGALAYTDCYDGNANAYPGSTYCGSVNRGDGSFDYNCDSVSSKTGCTVLNYSSSVNGTGRTVSCVGPAGGRFCGNYQNRNFYNPITTSCGSAGATCAGSTGGLDEDCTDDGVTCSKSNNGFTACTSLANVGNQSCK